ncbi:hypothetical protein [Photobacterium phosphoreum]|uniref:hypothetical protein n=1 Tax=Photobacterium phosphoreum TaxID=659 RepID=UPI0011B2272E|nr:hypothetical protein [Photobacterium phosphoreum]
MDNTFNFKILMKIYIKNRILATLVLLFFIVVSIIYIKITPAKWESIGSITNVNSNEITLIRVKYSDFYHIIDKRLSEKLDGILSDGYFIKEYKLEFNSFNNKKDFFRKYPNLIGGNNIESKVINYSEQFGLLNGKYANTYDISYISESKNLSNETLIKYNKYINDIVIKKIEMQLQSFALYEEKALDFKIKKLKNSARDKINNEIEGIKYALEITISAKIKDPITNFDVKNIFPVEYGSKVLKQQSDILKNFNDLSYLEPELPQLENELLLIDKIKRYNIDNFNAIKFIDNIHTISKNNSNKKTLIMFFGIILGFLFSIMSCLIKESLSKKNEEGNL